MVAKIYKITTVNTRKYNSGHSKVPFVKLHERSNEDS
jgi:hypothetical protein